MNPRDRCQEAAVLALRLATAANFLSAVAGRFGLWGGGNWAGFVDYTTRVNAFLPRRAAPGLAVAATTAELAIGLLLLIGWHTRKAALGAAALTLAFALAMSASFGAKEAFDYSVWVDVTSALVLATMPRFGRSLDAWLARRQNENS